MTDRDDYDWCDAEEKGDVVIFEQAAISVYTNPRGHVVVRQEGRFGTDEDHYIVITPENVAALCDAMLREAGPVARPDIDWKAVNEDFDRIEQQDTTTPGAARSRRYRQRKRDGVTPSVTPERDADRDGFQFQEAAE